METDQVRMGEGWRLLPLSFSDGPRNMALDEALLKTRREETPPTLRLYGWIGRCLSIGNSQQVADVDLEACRMESVPIVRRGSGGTAVLHEEQIAYSLVLPADHPLACADIVESYRRISIPLLQATRALGLSCRPVPPEEARQGRQPRGVGRSACFASVAPYELLCGGKKVVGNSQIRRRGVVLHHGVFPLDFDARRLARLLAADSEAERARLAEFLDERVGSLRWALGRHVQAPEVEATLCAGFSDTLGVRLEPALLSTEEARLARELVETRYGNPEWTFRR